MTLIAFGASWVTCFCFGWLVRGWVELERHPTIPEHPSLRRHTTQRPTLRVIDGDYQPYDQDRELRAE